jgi:hypothetical protein
MEHDVTNDQRLAALCAKRGTTAEAQGAVRFERDVVYAIVEIASRDGEDVIGVLVRAVLGDDVRIETLLVLEVGVPAWVADGPKEHVLLLSGGRLCFVRGSAVSFVDLDAPGFVGAMARLDADTLVLAGEEGFLLTWSDQESVPLDTDTEEDLLTVTGRPGSIVAGGTYGTLLRQAADGSFAPVPLLEDESRPRVTTVTRYADGALGIGLHDGRACRVVGDEISWLDVDRDDEARMLATATFAGHELFGDDAFGVWRRDGARLEKALDTGYAFRIDAREDRLTIDAGPRIVLIDGDLEGPRRELVVQAKPGAWLRGAD